MLKLYGDYYSGNCYKVKLLLNQLGQPFQWGRRRHTQGRKPDAGVLGEKSYWEDSSVGDRRRQIFVRV